MKFANLTPHAVTIYAHDDCIEQPDGSYTLRLPVLSTIPVARFYPSGDVARVGMHVSPAGCVLFDGVGRIPVCHLSYDSLYIPEPSDDVAFIVSAMTANAAKAAGRTTEDLFIPHGLVRDESGAVIGCTGFAQV